MLDESDLYDLYEESKKEALTWKEDYAEFERLADNDIIADLDENLPEVNDGTLAASLFKLPKRVVSTDLTGRVTTVDRDEAWVAELANMQWENEIIPNANTQAPFHRKWKDAVRKAAIYGSVPLVTIFTERGTYTGADFVVVQPQDVILEAGKVSDYDCDVIFWDVYFSKLQLKKMIATAKKEMKEAKDSGEDGYNKWNVAELQRILDGKQTEDRDSRDVPNQKDGKSVERGGYHFCVAFQRGVEAPFYMYSRATKKVVREWSNPDPTGDIPVHYLYCYQDFINPYGIGIVKLAGGTQNVLDYMRQADVLATQLGLEPPVMIKGSADTADIDSMVYERRAVWFTGQAEIDTVDTSGNVYQLLPDRIAMYKTSLNQLIPTGDTTISSSAGDPQYSKTPAGVKFQQASLSVDDEDFKDNLYITYAAVAKSMINTHFANMQGSDLMKLSDEERDILAKAGLEFPLDEMGNPSNELEVIWDEARGTFDFEVDPDQDKAKDDEKRLEGLLKVAELRSSDPNLDLYLEQSGKRLNVGELYAELISLTSDNDKIIQDIDPEELAEQQAQQAAMAQDPMAGGVEAPAQPSDEELAANMQAVMEQYGVDEDIAAAALDAEALGASPEEVIPLLQQYNQGAVDA